jgi:quinol monooxygenase YgiN
MFVVTVAFRSVPDRATDFLAALRENAATSLRDEPGCHRFDVCTDPDDPEAFFLYELYTDAQAFEAHKATRHFLAFDALVRDWTAGKTVKTYHLLPGEIR